MRVLVTGAGGFVGSNVVREAALRGLPVVGLVRTAPPLPDPGCVYVTVDLVDRGATLTAVEGARPDVIVHTAILNDFRLLYADRRAAWEAYVGVTRTLADAADAVGALLVYVSTDWVFDGVEGGYDETAPPNPVNYYGVLKAASELVALERTREVAVVRIAGVIGTHRARPELPRGQDPGFGYFVAAVVESLSRGTTFTVWESDAINARATPSLASHSARLLLDLAGRRLTGIYHCCGGEAATRMGLARATADVFGLDPGLLRSGPPDPNAFPPAPIPHDTSLDARATARALGVELLSLRELLGLFGAERSAREGEVADLLPGA
jgi:dTDP-4-dehydrorhamnose reductase